MDLSQFFNFFYSRSLLDTIFKIAAVSLSLFYVFYSLIISKQVRIMNESLQDKFNSVIFVVCSFQTAFALILFIFSVLFA